MFHVDEVVAVVTSFDVGVAAALILIFEIVAVVVLLDEHKLFIVPSSMLSVIASGKGEREM